MATSIINYIWLVTCLSFFIITDNVWSSCLNFPITLDCEIPQYLEVVTFCHSLQLLFIPAISSLQSTFTTKLPVAMPFHVIMPSFLPSFLFCLHQLTALTHHMGHRFSIPYFRTFYTGDFAVWSIWNLQSLFLGATYQGLSTSFQISFCNPLPSSIPVNTFPFSHILMPNCIVCCFYSFSISFTSFTLYSFGSTASEMLTTLLSPTLLSTASSPFLTYQLKLFSSLLTQLLQLIRPLPAFFLGIILATLHLGCSSFIVMIFLDFLVSIFWSSSLFHLIVPVP